MKNQFHWNIKQAGILSIHFELWCSLGDMVSTKLLLLEKDAFLWLSKFKVCLWEKHTHRNQRNSVFNSTSTITSSLTLSNAKLFQPWETSAKWRNDISNLEFGRD